jgi:hypothetical protein
MISGQSGSMKIRFGNARVTVIRPYPSDDRYKYHTVVRSWVGRTVQSV